MNKSEKRTLMKCVFVNFVCAEFLINGGDCSKDVRNGGWSVGRGERWGDACKIQHFSTNTHNKSNDNKTK